MVAYYFPELSDYELIFKIRNVAKAHNVTLNKRDLSAALYLYRHYGDCGEFVLTNDELRDIFKYQDTVLKELKRNLTKSGILSFQIKACSYRDNNSRRCHYTLTKISNLKISYFDLMQHMQKKGTPYKTEDVEMLFTILNRDSVISYQFEQDTSFTAILQFSKNCQQINELQGKIK